MIGSLITSQTRVKLLKKFFLNCNTSAYLRGLEVEFGESTNAIRIELNRLENAGLLKSIRDGRKKLYHANSAHPLYTDIHSIILKETGIDRVIEKVIHRIGNLFSVYLTGDFARGMDGETIELILVGRNINTEYLARKIRQAEELVGRVVRYNVINPEEIEACFGTMKRTDLLLLWDHNCEEE